MLSQFIHKKKIIYKKHQLYVNFNAFIDIIISRIKELIPSDF
jgi:hypothetical protein